MKFCRAVGLPDIVTHAKVDDDRFGHVCTRGRISGFPTDFGSRPYNTLPLARVRSGLNNAETFEKIPHILAQFLWRWHSLLL